MAARPNKKAKTKDLQSEAQEHERELKQQFKHLEHIHAQAALEHKSKSLECARAQALLEETNHIETVAMLPQAVKQRQESLKRVKKRVIEEEKRLILLASSSTLGVCTLSGGMTSTCTRLECDGIVGCTGWH